MQILMEELEGKKEFTANWDSVCEGCGNNILEGDTFYFFGEKRKVCQECFGNMQDEVGEK